MEDYTKIHKDFEHTINLIVESFEDAIGSMDGFKDLDVRYTTVVDHWYCKGKSPFSITKEERIKEIIELANIYFILKEPKPDRGGASLYDWEPKLEAELEIIRFKEKLLVHTKSLLKKIEAEGHKVWFNFEPISNSGRDYHGHIRIH